VDVLGIETSCDETAASIVGATGILADIVYTQEVHAAYGGVVPELASRAHAEKLPSVVRAALERAGVERPAAIAATRGPGLIGALLVGYSFGKSMASALDLPFIGVNHIEGHLLSPLLERPDLELPFLALVVSGGHTTLFRCVGLGRYDVLGDTIDDAAGECWDKVAKLLGLGYPGGPAVDRAAALGDRKAVTFPRSLPGDLDFSFSGLKTAVRTHAMRADRASDHDICASFQAAAVDVLVSRVEKAVMKTGIRRVAVAGGVAANSELRARMASTGLDVVLPARHRCTDNASMIAHVGRLHLLAGRRDGWDDAARPSWVAGTP
jgi:N6-L-threonylcarbamoyladenine synthase